VFEISIAEGKNPVGESAARQNPVTIGGVDGDNKIVGLVLNSDGSVTAKLAAGTAIVGKFIPVDADGDEKFTANNPASVQLTSSIVSAADKANATTSDQEITAEFNNVAVTNDGTNELRLCIDADSTAGVKIIYIAPGESFDKNLKGSELHYSVSAGSATFRYVLS